MSESKEKKKGFNLYNVFKRTKGFDRTTTEIPAIVSEPILWLKTKNGINSWIIIIYRNVLVLI